ncbi:hypothetical protein Tco_0858529 [Tanacetum coccineum]|uniref:Uncharacterized protein n=1 Tax=Tanacetum coccineum TaxID=301880 RepID=A0ABQ5BCP3_9ASTR
MLEISEPSVLTPVQESPSIATVTTLPPPSVSTTPLVPHQTTTLIPTSPITTDAPTITTTVSKSDALSSVQLRVAKLEKDVFELKTIDISAEALAALKTQVPSVVDNYLGSKQIPELPKKQTPTVDLEQEPKKSPLEILKIKKEQAEKQKMPKNPANHQLYHALMEALIEDENAMDKGVVDTVQDHMRKYDDDEDPLAGPNQGKKTKRRRTKESESSKKPSTTKETPKGKAPSKGSKTGKYALEKEPVKEPIAEVVMDDAGDDVVRDDDQPQDTSEPKTAKTPNPKWFTQPPRPPTPDPEWNKRQNNPEGDRYPFDLSKPLPLQGHPGHLTVAADYLLNSDLEYLKSSDPERTNVIVDFIVALRMFTRSLILKRRVKDLQLGVESYQKKLNITKPQKTFPEIEFKEPYTPSYDPPGISVHDEIYYSVLDFRLDYNTEMPKRKWMAVDRKRSGLMIELIDKQLREREIIRNLERLVGARELEMDYKLMTRVYGGLVDDLEGMDEDLLMRWLRNKEKNDFWDER